MKDSTRERARYKGDHQRATNPAAIVLKMEIVFNSNQITPSTVPRGAREDVSPAPPTPLDRARSLRAEPSNSKEKKLWKGIRGTKREQRVKRQRPCGRVSWLTQNGGTWKEGHALADTRP
ncbi:hypothetical protein EVAR_92827_1 [Eumeta japonica]|uniref:Uncharacterized protein n=1 Tax=Eumeta variegata TaxID=151549 RepID=A0A4C1TAU4_EUMVA|nr:hypothetical protein EVAR_92827_1 [Eumeta japonica]